MRAVKRKRDYSAMGRVGGAKGGKARTRKKVEAARANGLKGGRPPAPVYINKYPPEI